MIFPQIKLHKSAFKMIRLIILIYCRHNSQFPIEKGDKPISFAANVQL